jgi:hypothetical protein
MTFKRLFKACSTGQNEVGKLRDRTQTKGCSGRIFSIGTGNVMMSSERTGTGEEHENL